MTPGGGREPEDRAREIVSKVSSIVADRILGDAEDERDPIAIVAAAMRAERDRAIEDCAGVVSARVGHLITERVLARTRKDFALADRLEPIGAELARIEQAIRALRGPGAGAEDRRGA